MTMLFVYIYICMYIYIYKYKIYRKFWKNDYQVVFVNGGCHVKNFSKHLLNRTLIIIDSGKTGVESGCGDVE